MQRCLDQILVAKSGSSAASSYHPLSLAGIVEYVASQTHPVGLNMQCKEEVIGHIVESGGLTVKEEILNGAVGAVHSYCDTL